jgi:hypothetical protein
MYIKDSRLWQNNWHLKIFYMQSQMPRVMATGISVLSGIYTICHFVLLARIAYNFIARYRGTEFALFM